MRDITRPSAGVPYCPAGKHRLQLCRFISQVLFCLFMISIIILNIFFKFSFPGLWDIMWKMRLQWCERSQGEMQIFFVRTSAVTLNQFFFSLTEQVSFQSQSVLAGQKLPYFLYPSCLVGSAQRDRLEPALGGAQSWSRNKYQSESEHVGKHTAGSQIQMYRMFSQTPAAFPLPKAGCLLLFLLPTNY